LCAADLKRHAAPVLAFKLQKVERDEACALGASIGSQRREVAMAIRPDDDRLAIEQDAIDRQGPHSLRNSRKMEDHNQQSQPFTWTADPDKIIAAVRRGHQALDSIH
jgi:hypothetical protein